MSLTSEPLTEERLNQFPAFVRQYLTDQILDHCQFEETEEACREAEQECFAQAEYAEVDGTIDHPYQNVSKLVNFWIASHDNVELHIHIGGSVCWIEPDNHYLFFHPIAPDLLVNDQHTWWVITRDYKVIRITIRPEEEVITDFPDIG